jgi:hypothetical protein
MQHVSRGVLGLVVAAGIAAACAQLGSSGGGGAGSSGASGPMTPLPAGKNGTCLGDPTTACADSAGITAFGACVSTQCNSAYTACFGPDYRTGSYAGDCQDWANCTGACAGCDSTCLASCRDQHYTQACDTCVTQQLQPCISNAIAAGQCSAPCASDAGAGGAAAADASTSTGGCTSLAFCCNMLPPEDATNCQIALTESGDVDSACDNALATYRASGKCP